MVSNLNSFVLKNFSQNSDPKSNKFMDAIGNK